MKYDFDSVTDRKHSNSLKWNVAENELPMWVADMDFKTAPEIEEAISNRMENGIFGYSEVTDEWYAAYMNWWKNRHNFRIEKEWLIFCTGVIPAISSIVRKITTPAEKVVIQTPVYNIFFNSILNNGRVVNENKLIYENGKYSIDFKDLEEKIISNQQAEQLNFTVDDILLKRDMDYINKIKLPLTYHVFEECWPDLDRDDKADIVMRYIDNIELEEINNMYVVKKVNFRSTFYEDFKMLFNQGYIDCKREMIIDFNGVQTSVPVRYSEFTSIKDVMQNFYRLNECYEVNLYKGTFYKDTEKLDIGPILKYEVPVRIFPLQKNNNGDNNWLSMGMLATKNNPNDIKVNIRDVFETIPDNVTEEDF